MKSSGKIFANGWEAKLVLDLKVLEISSVNNMFLANVYRIDYTTNSPTRYLAFNPTGTPTPCFHVPSKFEKFTLVGWFSILHLVWLSYL